MKALDFSCSKQGQCGAINRKGDGLLVLGCVDFQKSKTINGENYPNVLRQLQKAIKSTLPGKLTKGVLFHQDNVSAHNSVVAMSLHMTGFGLIDHPLYSPD